MRRKHSDDVPRQTDWIAGEAADDTEDEHCVTPAWLSRILVDRLPLYVAPGLWPVDVLDAGAGRGVLASAVEQACSVRQVTAVEKHQRRTAAWPPHWRRVVDDLFVFVDLAVATGRTWSLIVTNPPFSLWFEWVAALRRVLAPGGVLAALSPAEYLHRSQAWWARCLPLEHVTTDLRPWDDVREVAWSVWVGPQGHAETRLVRVPAPRLAA